jgi:2-C-methyl-D-erythritol 4-phosphate cytidylyltransferase
MNIKEWIAFKIYNFKNNIKYKPSINNNSNFNIGLLLAAGTSSRFSKIKSKQLSIINDDYVISHSIKSIINIVDKLVIITNSKCYNEIFDIIKNNKIIILTNDINCRIESIKTGLLYINKNYNDINNIIIHDVARPYLTEKHFNLILKSNETFQYSQYYLKLVNGLAKKNKTKYDIHNRDEYIEICSPICCKYNLYYFIFMNYIGNNKPFTNEPITILNMMNIDCNYIEGYHQYLRKITYIDDIY